MFSFLKTQKSCKCLHHIAQIQMVTDSCLVRGELPFILLRHHKKFFFWHVWILCPKKNDVLSLLRFYTALLKALTLYRLLVQEVRFLNKREMYSLHWNVFTYLQKNWLICILLVRDFYFFLNDTFLDLEKDHQALSQNVSFSCYKSVHYCKFF